MGRELGSRVVYVIGVGDNPVKIGVADRIRARLTALQIGCPDKLRVHHISKAPWPLAQRIEERCHREFEARHRRGEWFNIDKLEAAVFIEEEKARLLSEFQWSAKERGDLLVYLAAVFHLRADARDAVWDYQDRMETREDPYVAHANGYILKNAGMAAYGAFSLVVAQRKGLSGLRPSELAKAHGALASAINHLAIFRAQYRKEFGARLHMLECKALIRSVENPTRPPSLPPVRAA